MGLRSKRLGDLVSPSLIANETLADLEISGLTADSRKVEQGFLFVAIKGEKSDGAAFIPSAIENGAVACIVQAPFEGTASIPIIAVDNPRLELAKAAARFFDLQPRMIAAVTGTSGKTSVAAFLRQIWAGAGLSAASIGTVGVVSPSGETYGSLTTPDPVSFHETLAQLADDGVSHVALEASSHGLEQHRLDGARISMAAFTNLGRDHLDYHPTMEDYFNAKMRLFEALLPTGAPAIVNPDTPYGDEAADRARKAGLDLRTVGPSGSAIRLLSAEPDGFAQRLQLDFGSGTRDVLLPLAGAFQVENALTAAGLASADGLPDDMIAEQLECLKGAPGRLEFVGKTQSGALCFIDYAHKVEALESVLAALRPYASGKLCVVFGAGGDRDRGKRPLMGKAAREGADHVIVTDDNPRGEDPATIRQAILAAVPDALEIGDREEAIVHALQHANSGDVVVIAGKGHETGQIVGDTVLPFSDHDVVRKALQR
ncbi:MAG: UDP-N-acetylmuramoyl-L-alanyl-D-glutamate--2,6-diaminopimelate ligase [Pseudomonadota bacterium]